ncbi:MAG: DUF4363 family protein [Agathobaculum sp.]|jgi:hypothetical protein|uniref:DUF4363 family protein n=1 Tax=Agathobaculum sp. TaxID=2048138 RepID=UPI003D8C3E15
MRRLLIAASLLILTAGGCIWSSRMVSAAANEIADDIENGHLSQAYLRWNDAQPLFGALLLHDEIDTAGRLFARILAAERTGDQDSLSSDRAELLFQLRHLPELEKPILKNLL